MRLLKYVLIIFVFTVTANSQSKPWWGANAHPRIGWDSLKTRIGYPEIARRAGIQAIAYVHFMIDSTGQAQNIDVVAPEMFISQVKNAVQLEKWFVDNSDKRQRSNWYTLEIQFKLEQPENLKPKVITIESKVPSIYP